jgi:DNA-binding response OmpR family regulator
MNAILIADDDKDIVELLRLYLEKDGFQVIEAYDGFMAYEVVKNQKIDIAILDIMMPNLDGFRLVQKIREEYPIPLILLSAKGDDNSKILGLGLGADDFISKPFNPLEVIARVQAQLRRSYLFNKSTNQKGPSPTIKMGNLIFRPRKLFAEKK